jgi:hypothetical protein
MKKFLKKSENAPAFHFGLSELPEGQYPTATSIGHRLITIGYINHAWPQAIHHYLVAWNHSLGLGCNYHRAYKRQASQLKDNRASHEDAGRSGSISFVDIYAWSLFYFFVSRLKKYFDEIS